MSLFEDDRYMYCDTFFVYLDANNRPTENKIKETLTSGSEKYQLSDARSEPDGSFKSITVRSPHDSSGMDIVFVSGDEVREQVVELIDEFRQISLEGDDFAKLKRVENSSARIDVFHFEETSDSAEPDMIDPGGLFLILEKLNKVCDGVGLDPQSKTLI
jgi:hypothetical protein